MPRYLTEQDIADFRAELCKVATERFARYGYEGVTMRQLAEALGCSPKTPYRYFKDKADILATVRAQAFTRFSEALEKAAAGVTDPAQRGRLTSQAYLQFALKNPHAYRIMFEIDAPVDDKHPELGPAAEHATRFITRGAEELVAAGAMDVDPKLFGYTMWAGMATFLFAFDKASTGTTGLAIILVVLAIFVAWERRTTEPMLDMSFFRAPAFSTGMGGMILIFLSMYGVLFMMTQYFQLVLGYTALSAALRLMPIAAIMLVVAPFTPRLSARFGAHRTVAFGMLSIGLGFALFRLFDISKFPPGRRLERLPGGLGVMADDVIAAFFALLVLAVAKRVLG